MTPRPAARVTASATSWPSRGVTTSARVGAVRPHPDRDSVRRASWGLDIGDQATESPSGAPRRVRCWPGAGRDGSRRTAPSPARPRDGRGHDDGTARGARAPSMAAGPAARPGLPGVSLALQHRALGSMSTVLIGRVDGRRRHVLVVAELGAVLGAARREPAAHRLHAPPVRPERAVEHERAAARRAALAGHAHRGGGRRVQRRDRARAGRVRGRAGARAEPLRTGLGGAGHRRRALRVRAVPPRARRRRAPEPDVVGAAAGPAAARPPPVRRAAAQAVAPRCGHRAGARRPARPLHPDAGHRGRVPGGHRRRPGPALPAPGRRRAAGAGAGGARLRRGVRRRRAPIRST